MKANFIKTEKKQRHYTDEQLEKIDRSKGRDKRKRGRKPIEY